MLNEFELFYFLQDFIKKYFGLTPTINRENMFKMLYKDENIQRSNDEFKRSSDFIFRAKKNF